MMTRNYRLLEADMCSYYPMPKWWVRWKYQPPQQTIIGVEARFWLIGFAAHVGPGVYHTGRRWIVFHYDEYQDWLDNGGF